MINKRATEAIIMKRILITLFTVLIVAAVVLLTSRCTGMEKEMDEFVRNDDISTPDLSAIADGVYEGSYRSGIVRAKVRVGVSDHQIISIEILRHFNGKGKPAEAVIDDVISAQSVEVDVIAGATYSSKVILKSIETALAGG